MNRSIRIGAAAIAAFLIILIARFPARWAAHVLPKNIQCEHVAGTVWNGACLGLIAQGTPIGDVKWDLHLLRLFTGKVGVQLAWTRGSASAAGDLDLSFSGSVSARNVQAILPLDPSVLPLVPPNTRGSARANLVSLKIDGRAVTGVEGQIEVRGLEQSGTTLGDYRLTFPAAQSGAEPVGQLVDLDGPFSVQGTLRLTHEPGYVLEGQVAAKPGAPAGLARQIEFLGRPDAQGRRPFSLAGTY